MPNWGVTEVSTNNGVMTLNISGVVTPPDGGGGGAVAPTTGQLWPRFS